MQVMNHLAGAHGISRDEAGTFVSSEMAALEDYEVDLILSPLFTPTLKDQSIFAGTLERDSIPVEQWPGLIQQLVGRPTEAQLLDESGTSHGTRLREVTIARYVNRLRLDGTIADDIFSSITRTPSSTNRSLLMAVARRAIWQSEPRRQILSVQLSHTDENEAEWIEDTVRLLSVMETYRPADLTELFRQIPHWIRVLQQEIADAGAKPFFNERVEELHGGGRDQRRQDNQRVIAKQQELAFLQRLLERLSSRSATGKTH